MGIFQVCIGYIRHMLGMSFKNIVGKYLGHILLVIGMVKMVGVAGVVKKCLLFKRQWYL